MQAGGCFLRRTMDCGLVTGLRKGGLETSWPVQWLGLCAFTAKGPGSIPGQGYKISTAKEKKKESLRLWRVEILALTIVMDGIAPAPTPGPNPNPGLRSYVEALTPSVTVFRDEALKDKIKLKQSH